MIEALRSAVESHAGEFVCAEIHAEGNTKFVPFRHVASDPVALDEVPDVPGLRAFYATFGDLTLYLDDESGEAAYFIADPSQWRGLRGEFEGWLDGLDGDEMDECVPTWVADCIVVGEIPRSGNYLLVPSTGPNAGKLFEFEHDGFEFFELGASLANFAQLTLDLTPRQLTEMASHMRFIVGDHNRQWWINEMRDNRGNVVKTMV